MTRQTQRTKLIRRIAILFVAAAAIASSSLTIAQDEFDDYSDKVFLKNGDRITGTIKDLDRGKLRIKTRTMDTIYVNWVDVESIQSNTYLRIRNTDGTYRYGRIQQSDMTENMSVLDNGRVVDVPAIDVAGMKPIRVDETFWHRIEGDVSAGIDYKKAGDILLVNVASNLRFREENYELAFGFNWNETTRTETNNSSRADVSGDYSRLLQNQWFWKASGGLERNQELGIDLRTIVSGTGGKYLFQTSTMRFEVNAGLAVSTENRTDNSNQESVEGLIRSSFDLFKLNIPMTRLSANISVYPGITESSRVRVNTDITLRNEIIHDFFWDLSFYSSFDNQPAPGFEEQDFGIVTSLGATF